MPRLVTDSAAGPRADRKLLGQGSIYLVAAVAPILVSLGITPVLTRLLGPYEYGLVGISITLYQLGGVLLGLGFPTAITRHAILEKSGLAGASGIAVTSGGLAAVLGAFLLLTAPLWSIFIMPAEHQHLVVWPLASAIGLSALTGSQAMFRAAERVGTFASFAALAAFLPPCLGLVTAGLAGPTAENYLPLVSAGHLLVGAASLVWACQGRRIKIAPREVAAALRIGLPTVPHQVASSILTAVIVATAVATSGVVSAGGLQLAIMLGSTPMVLLGAINNAWAPMIYRSPSGQRTSLLGSTFRTVSVLVLLLLTGFAVLGPSVISLVGGPVADQPSVIQSAMIIAAATVGMCLYLVNIHLVFLSGRTSILALTTPMATAIAVTIAAITMGLPSAPLWGPAFAVPCFHLLQAVSGSFLRHRTGLSMAPIRRGLITASLGIVALAVAGVSADIWLTFAAAASALVVGGMLNLRHIKGQLRRTGEA